MSRSERWPWLLFLLPGCTWDAPVVGSETPANVVSGTAFVGAAETTGDAIVFLTDASNPMPPLGTGSPATFAAVPAERFSSGPGLPSADFTVTGVPDGDWMVTGLLDVDQDFHPLVPGGAMAGATCGDLVGAWVSDLQVPVPAVLPLSNGARVDDVTVTLASALTTERPAFTLTQPTPLDRAAAASDPGTPQGFALQAAGVYAGFEGDVTLRLDGPYDPADPRPCQTAFLVEVPDADKDGLPDPHPLLPEPFFDVSPDIFLQWIPPTTDVDGAPLGPDGEPLEGRSWASLAVPSPAGLLDGSLPAPGTGPALVPALSLVWVPAGTLTEGDGTEVPITDPRELPSGAWSVTVVQATGQTWTVPNGLALAVSTQPERFDPATQAATLTLE